MALVPKNYIPLGTTRVFGGNDVPTLLLERHKTRSGFYSQIEVLKGDLLWFGYHQQHGTPWVEVRLSANERAMTHPGQLYRIELLSPDALFRFNVFAHESLHNVDSSAGSTVSLFLEQEPLPEPDCADHGTDDEALSMKDNGFALEARR